MGFFKLEHKDFWPMCNIHVQMAELGLYQRKRTQCYVKRKYTLLYHIEHDQDRVNIRVLHEFKVSPIKSTHKMIYFPPPQEVLSFQRS